MADQEQVNVTHMPEIQTANGPREAIVVDIADEAWVLKHRVAKFEEQTYIRSTQATRGGDLVCFSPSFNGYIYFLGGAGGRKGVATAGD